jgi:hypothetical protein
LSPGDYVAELHRVLQSHPFIATYHLGTDVRGESFLYVTGKVEFLFGSTLDFKEFLEFHQDRVEKYKYAYNYRECERVLFRYDNAADPRAVDLPTYPAHKHEGDTLKASSLVDLPAVLAEILRFLPNT